MKGESQFPTNGAGGTHKQIFPRVTLAKYSIRALWSRIGAVGAAPFVPRVRILSMRNPLRRYYGRRDLHFVTFSCYRRRPYLGTRRARDQFVKVLDQYYGGSK